jgi:hypothetical protein
MMKLLVMQFSFPSCCFRPLRSNHCPHTPILWNGTAMRGNVPVEDLVHRHPPWRSETSRYLSIPTLLFNCTEQYAVRKDQKRPEGLEIECDTSVRFYVDDIWQKHRYYKKNIERILVPIKKLVCK